MKRQVFTLIGLLPIALLAQQLDSADIIPQIGDSTSYHVMKNPHTIPAPVVAGNNSTWDFSEITEEDSTVIKFEKPVSGGLGADPANTTVAEQFSGRFGSRVQYKASATSLYIMGERKGFTQTSYGNDSLLKFNFPAKYNDSFTTTINSESGRIVKTYRKGSYKVTIDGYGKLILPYGDLPDIFRVKVEMNYRDSSRFRQTNYSNTAYEYWQKGSISYVMKVEYEDDDGTKDTIVIYRKSQDVIFNPTNIEALSANETIKLYPNPANNVVSVQANTLSATTTYRIFNIVGKTEMKGTFEDGSSINIEELPSGLHFIEIPELKDAPIRFIKN